MVVVRLAVAGLILTIDRSKIWKGKRGKSGSHRSNAKSYPKRLLCFGAQPSLETVESGAPKYKRFEGMAGWVA